MDLYVIIRETWQALRANNLTFGQSVNYELGSWPQVLRDGLANLAAFDTPTPEDVAMLRRDISDCPELDMPQRSQLQESIGDVVLRDNVSDDIRWLQILHRELCCTSYWQAFISR